MLPTSFEKIPDIIREIEQITGLHTWAEVNFDGSIYFCQNEFIGRHVGTNTLFNVEPKQDIFVNYIHWKWSL